MFDTLRSLFREDLVPHGYCIAWQPEILWLHVISDLVIVFAYYSIPLTLWYFVRRRTDMPFKPVLYLFIGFIFACGTSHAIEIVTFWKAMYGLEGIAKAVTAGVSLTTAILLVPLTPKALALRSPKELERLNKKLAEEVATRRAAEEELTKSYAELERRVAERTAELSEAKTSLEREIEERVRAEEDRGRLAAEIQQTHRLESLGAMAEGVAHDFNNLLTVISARTQMLQESTDIGPGSREALEQIMLAVQAAADLSGQMLVYSGYGAVKKDPVDVSRLVEDLRPLLSAAVSRHAELSYSLVERLPGVVSDASQLRQVVINLAVNASESDDAGAPLSVRIATGRTCLADEQPATSELSFLDSDRTPCVFVEVADSGLGMDMETQQRIFDPFFSTKFAGRGLGLAVVMGIVRGLGGAVRVQSQQGAGTKMRVLLPATETVVHRNVPAVPDAECERGDGCVLVVDDDDAVRQVLSAILLNAGYEVQTAAGGQQALEILDSRGHAIELVILDLTMPLISGDEVLEQMRARGFSMPVVLTSGYDAGRAEHGLTAGGAAGFLAKPFSRDQLLRIVAANIRHDVAAERRPRPGATPRPPESVPNLPGPSRAGRRWD